jgi:hypothetical protein
VSSTGEITLRHLDESGFSLTSNSSYVWEEKDDLMTGKSQRSDQFNVLGLMNTTRELDSYVLKGGVTSIVVIICINEFSKSLTKTTTIVMEQASIHINTSMEN